MDFRRAFRPRLDQFPSLTVPIGPVQRRRELRRRQQLSPPLPIFRRILICFIPSDSIRAFTASVVNTSRTKFVAVLSLTSIIRFTPSRSVRCSPSENSCRIPEPETLAGLHFLAFALLILNRFIIFMVEST